MTSVRGQLKFALVLFYILAFFTEDVLALSARFSAFFVMIGVLSYLIATRRHDL